MVTYVATTIPGVRPTPGFHPWIDGRLQLAAYALTAALVVARAVLIGRARRFWALLAASMVFRGLGFVLHSTYVRDLDPVPYPSVADAAWLLAAVLLVVAMVDAARGRADRPPVTIALDAVTGALVVAALAAALLLEPLLALSAGVGPQAVVVNLAYPVLDVASIIVLLWVLASLQWRVAGPIAWVTLGVFGYAAVGILFAYQVAEGSFRPGGPVSGLSAAATAVIGLAAWARATTTGWNTTKAPPGLVLPLIWATVSWALLVVAALADLGRPVALLAAAAAAVALIRTAWGFQQGRALEEQRRLARTDELTGLANRRALVEDLEGSARRGWARSLLLLDLTGFRAVNDDFGQAHGDVALRIVGSRLRDAVGTDDLVVRLGADVFGVLLATSDETGAELTADRLRGSVRRPLDVDGRIHVFAAKVGQASDNGSAIGLGLLRRAELALGDAKRRDVGHVRFDPLRHTTEEERHRRIGRVQRALETGELRVHFQPQVALATGEIVGVEALVRWEHPDEGLLAPDRFLPAMEQAGLMRPLFAEVLRQSLQQVADWRGQGHDLSVACNLTVADLLDPELADQVGEALALAGLEGRHLTLELTEDVFLAEPGRALRAVADLRDRGVELFIDDFGTGYSSLSYLRDLGGLAGLKIDRSFIRDLDRDLRLQAIVGSTLQLATSLGLQVVAEGVESPEARAWLVAAGCRLGQGCVFAPAVPGPQLDPGHVFGAVPSR